MRLSTRGRASVGRSCVGALVALLAAGLLAPSTARASCSWYALANHGAPGAPDGLGLLTRTTTLPDGPRPCSGVFCSGQPGLPVVPSTAVTPQPHDWGLLAAPPAPSAPDSFPRHHDDDRLRPVHTGEDVFHPPRIPSPV
jgi:hypothetical protein